jgi:hypothetical protein
MRGLLVHDRPLRAVLPTEVAVGHTERDLN